MISQQKLEALHNYYQSRRGIGHTTLMLKGVENSKQYAVLALSLDHARQLSRELTNSPTSILSYQNLSHQSLFSLKQPLAIDNSAMISILNDAISLINAKDRRIQELIDQLKESKSYAGLPIKSNDAAGGWGGC